MWKTALLILAMTALELDGAPVMAARHVDATAPPAVDGRAATPNEPSYLGKPLGYWLKSLHNRDSQMDVAFDAILYLGPAAASAVPELTQIIAEPFAPIEIGVDGDRAVIDKLHRLQQHSSAVDCLAAIGKSAAVSATALAEWALATKVIPGNIRGTRDQGAFIDLVGLDVLERMRVAGAIAQFTPEASMVVAGLLKSPDEDRRKLGVAILSERALPIATELLKARNCEEQKLGLRIIADMWPVVSREHLLDLQEMLPCTQPAKR